MKLVASLIVAEAERDRYLEECVGHLLEFCDEVVLVFDGDGRWSGELVDVWGDAGARVVGVTPSPGVEPVDFFAHEGRARQRLLEATLAREPTHVLAIDADEFVTHGPSLRRRLKADRRSRTWTLQMEEVWELDGECLCIREDGGWRAHPIPIVWRVQGNPSRYRIADRALACGRVPTVGGYGQVGATDVGILHFGWANQAERVARHHRYAVADGGRFHAGSHLESILWPEERVTLRGRKWPAELAAYRPAITARALREEAA